MPFDALTVSLKADSLFLSLRPQQLRYAVPELRKTKGSIVAATSGAGAGALFSGWGFYGMSKAAVAFLISQLHLEEKDITTVGISPGLCDTKMIESLRSGKGGAFLVLFPIDIAWNA